MLFHLVCSKLIHRQSEGVWFICSSTVQLLPVWKQNISRADHNAPTILAATHHVCWWVLPHKHWCSAKGAFSWNGALAEYSCLVILTPFHSFCSALCSWSIWFRQVSSPTGCCQGEGDIGSLLSALGLSLPLTLSSCELSMQGERGPLAAGLPKSDQC